MLAFSARRGTSYVRCAYRADDRLFFGRETSGLDEDVLARFGQEVYSIPMAEPGVRSLNLANAASIVVYEALRQLGRL
jgi:tRNA (cytidine/uridine-2'-O-)-methyltransferase